jgi:alkylation response protein AidB-like acyl-CoA dehydrogenase
MDFDMPADDDPRRVAVRAWLAEHPDPTDADLHSAGYIAPHWPPPYGIDADPLHQLIIDDELRAGGVGRTSVSTNAIGVGWAAPTIYMAGTDWQKQRFLDPIFRGEEFWCQLFSEPDAGSDLAGLATRAVRDGDEYVINGSKIWTSGGHHAQFGILIARTDADLPKHKGLSYFIVPMDLPGITLSPIVDMTTAHSFNQTFFDDVRLPSKYRVGEEGDGWRLAKVTLANERVSLSASGSMWGTGPSAGDLLDIVRDTGGITDPRLRQQAAALHIESEVLRLNRLRTLTARLQGRAPGAEASIQKILGDEHGQHVMELALELTGSAGMLSGAGPIGELPLRGRSGPTENNLRADTQRQFPGVDPVWHYGFLFAPALTIGGGTFAVQRNIVAEQVLGLPREPDLERGLSWAETRRRPS